MPIRKRGHFTDEMSAGKFKKRKIYIEKRKSLKIKVLRFLVPGAGAGFFNLSSSRVNLMECSKTSK